MINSEEHILSLIKNNEDNGMIIDPLSLCFFLDSFMISKVEVKKIFFKYRR